MCSFADTSSGARICVLQECHLRHVPRKIHRGRSQSPNPCIGRIDRYDWRDITHIRISPVGVTYRHPSSYRQRFPSLARAGKPPTDRVRAVHLCIKVRIEVLILDAPFKEVIYPAKLGKCQVYPLPASVRPSPAAVLVCSGRYRACHFNSFRPQRLCAMGCSTNPHLSAQP